MEDSEYLLCCQSVIAQSSQPTLWQIPVMRQLGQVGLGIIMVTKRDTDPPSLSVHLAWETDNKQLLMQDKCYNKRSGAGVLQQETFTLGSEGLTDAGQNRGSAVAIGGLVIELQEE